MYEVVIIVMTVAMESFPLIIKCHRFIGVIYYVHHIPQIVA